MTKSLDHVYYKNKSMLAPCFVLHLSDKIEWHQQYNYQERVMIMVFTQAELHTWQEKHPLLKNILNLEPVFWQNPNIRRTKNLHSQSITKEDMYEANALWERFSPFLSHAFPETREAGGKIGRASCRKRWLSAR